LNQTFPVDPHGDQNQVSRESNDSAVVGDLGELATYDLEIGQTRWPGLTEDTRSSQET